MVVANLNKFEIDSTAIVEGNIPPAVFSVAASQNIESTDIWGVYLTPEDPRNPIPGEHYLGLKNVENIDFRSEIEDEMKTLKDNDGQMDWTNALNTIVKLPEESIRVIRDEGLNAIKAHELKHKEQSDKYRYQSVILSAYEIMSRASLDKRKEILRKYQDLILMVEVQALSAQCGRESVNTEEQRLFNIYWFSKTFRLFNRKDIQKYVPTNIKLDDNGKLHVDYVSKEIEQLESLYISIRNQGDYSRNIANPNGLLSRALYVCDDPAKTLKDIREGKINYEEFQKRVLGGLVTFLKADTETFSIKSKDVEKRLENPINNLVNELEILIS